MLIVIISLFFIGLSAEPMKCNGFAQLCDRRLNETAWITSHDATSNVFSAVNDQDRSIEQQLNDGIRGFKIPIYYDYVNFLGYYRDLIDWYGNSYLKSKIMARIQEVNNSQKDAIEKIQKALDDVNGLQSEIDQVAQEIDKYTRWYNNLPKFSWTEKSQTSEAIPYAARIATWQTEKVTLQAAMKTAQRALELVKKSTAIIDPLLDPEVIALKSEHIVAQGALTALNAFPEDSLKRQILACHGLDKGQIYANWVDAIFNEMPAAIKNIFKPLQSGLTKAFDEFRKGIFGERQDIGRLLPYTPCGIDLGKVPLKDTFKTMVNWLKKNPHEVLIIFLEDRAYNGEDLTKILKEAGMFNFLWQQSADEPWPTLRELIKKGKRVIIFISTKNYGPEYPWLHYESTFNPWALKWDYRNTDEILKEEFDPAEHFRSETHNITGYGPHGNWIFTIPHSITSGASGTKSNARIINKQDVIETRAIKFMDVTGRILNAFGPDFYEMPCTGNEATCTRKDMDLFKALDHINGVGIYKGHPLVRNKTVDGYLNNKEEYIGE